MSHSVLAVDAGSRRTANSRSTLIVAAAGTFLSLAAYTLPLSDFAALSASLSAGPAAQTWILSSMSLGLTATMLLAGTLADRYGRRLMFLLGATVLAIGSLLPVGASVSSGQLRAAAFVAGRIIEGAGAAAVVASALALIAEAFPQPHQRTMASSVWGAALGAGISVGPVGAAIADRVGHWWLAYLGLAVLTALLAGAGAGLLVESRSVRRRRADLIGTAVFVGATVLLLTGLVWFRSAASPRGPLIMVASAVGLLVIFAISQSLVAEPMLDLRLFRQPRFAAVHLAALITGFGSIGLMSLVGSYLLIVLGFGVWQATALIVVWAGSSTMTAVAARWIPVWFHPGRQLGWGLLVIAAGQLILIRAGSAAVMVAGLLVAGIASGVVNAGLGRETAASSPQGESGLGSGVNNTARYLGSAIGVTVAATLLLHGGHDPARLHAGWSTAVLVCSTVAALGGVAVLAIGRRAGRTDR